MFLGAIFKRCMSFFKGQFFGRCKHVSFLKGQFLDGEAYVWNC